MKTKRFYAAVLIGTGKPNEPMGIMGLYYFDSESMRKAWLKEKLSVPFDKNHKDKVKLLSRVVKQALKFHTPY